MPQGATLSPTPTRPTLFTPFALQFICLGLSTVAKTLFAFQFWLFIWLARPGHKLPGRRSSQIANLAAYNNHISFILYYIVSNMCVLRLQDICKCLRVCCPCQRVGKPEALKYFNVFRPFQCRRVHCTGFFIHIQYTYICVLVGVSYILISRLCGRSTRP